MEAYLQIRENLFYCISEGKCHAINTDKQTFKNLVSIPSAFINDVKVINKEVFEAAKKGIGL